MKQTRFDIIMVHVQFIHLLLEFPLILKIALNKEIHIEELCQYQNLCRSECYIIHT